MEQTDALGSAPRAGSKFCSVKCWMPWTSTHFPSAMQNLWYPVRLKAIEIANALLEKGVDEGQAIRIAIAQAKKWAHRSGCG